MLVSVWAHDINDMKNENGNNKIIIKQIGKETS